MKLFKSVNVSLINDSRLYSLSFYFPSEILEKKPKISPELYVLCQHIALFWSKCRLICYNVCDN